MLWCDQNDILKSMEHIKASDRAKIESGPLLILFVV